MAIRHANKNARVAVRNASGFYIRDVGWRIWIVTTWIFMSSITSRHGSKSSISRGQMKIEKLIDSTT